MKIKPTNLPVTRKTANDPLECFSKPKPTEISDEDWECAKTWAHGSRTRIPSNLRELAYRRFYQQYSFDDIASKFELDVGCVIYTAIYDDWFTKIKKEKRVRGSDGVERLDKDMKDILTDIVQGLSISYTEQFKAVQQGTMSASECNLIPKNLKEVQILLAMIQTLQPKEVPIESKSASSVTNVNVQNLIAGNNGLPNKTTVQSNHLAAIAATNPSLIPYEDEDDEECENDGDDELDLLLRAKGNT